MDEQQNLLQPIPELQQELALEEVADNMGPQVDVQLPVLNAPMENFLHHEIPEEYLMDLGVIDQLVDVQAQIEDGQEQMSGMGLEGDNQLGDVQMQLDDGQEQVAGAEGPVFQHNIQLGLVRTYFVNPPETPKPAESYWLAPKAGNNLKNADRAVIEVPAAWLGFFQAILQALAQHKWAKQLLGTNFS